MIFESHGHYDDEQFQTDREELLSSFKENGIRYVVNVGSDLGACKRSLELAETYEFIYAALGIHPSETEDLNEEAFAWIKGAAEKEKIVAIGEIGLDYYWVKEAELQKQQQEWFVRQIALAKEVNLPIIIHSRDAAEDTYEILKEYAKGLDVVLHCYSYDREMAEKYLDLGFYLGIGGVVTFKNAKDLKEVVAFAPMERILVETDCPYLAPVPFRGKRNSSLYLPYIIEAIAELKGMTAQEVEEISFENGKSFFRIG
jgi:TatD DNase family protein